MSKKVQSIIRTEDKIIGAVLIVLIILVVCFNFDKQELGHFASTIDFIGSLVLISGMLISSLILLANVLPYPRLANLLRYLISMAPENSHFSQKLKNYLFGLLHENKKVIIFLPKITDGNEEAVFLQIIGFNNYLDFDLDPDNIKLHLPEKNNIKSIYKYDVEIVFLKANSDDIPNYFSEKLENNIEYIILTGMSEVFQDAVLSREELSDEKLKKQIKIVGALSAISTDIESIINKDKDVIRVFPPDYDESKIAIDFLMSRIKNNICHSRNNCDFKAKKSNIIIIHAREYGKAIKDRCEEFFKEEMYNVNKNTNFNLEPQTLEDIIHLYSYTYNNTANTLIYDYIESENFEKKIEVWSKEGHTNYFFIVGYEPSISKILKKIQPLIKGKLSDYCFLFSAPASLEVWKNNINTELCEQSKSRKNYYIYSQTFIGDGSGDNEIDCNVDFSNYSVYEYEDKNILVKKRIRDIIEKCNSDTKFKKNNFVSNFAKLGINVVVEYVQTGESLLLCKEKVFKNNIKHFQLLVNGDTINNFEIHTF